MYYLCWVDGKVSQYSCHNMHGRERWQVVVLPVTRAQKVAHLASCGIYHSYYHGNKDVFSTRRACAVATKIHRAR
jgi:hypothetical protein